MGCFQAASSCQTMRMGLTGLADGRTVKKAPAPRPGYSNPPERISYRSAVFDCASVLRVLPKHPESWMCMLFNNCLLSVVRSWPSRRALMPSCGRPEDARTISHIWGLSVVRKRGNLLSGNSPTTGREERSGYASLVPAPIGRGVLSPGYGVRLRQMIQNAMASKPAPSR